MYEETEQEFPALTDDETAETKKDPFTEIFEAENGTPIEDGTLTDGFSETEMQQLQELMEMQQTETATSVPVDVETFNSAIDNLAITLCSAVLFAAFMICGCMAAIKMFGGKI